MITTYALVITILKKEDIPKFKRRKLWENREGNYCFFKRVKATEYDKFKNEISKIGEVKIS